MQPQRPVYWYSGQFLEPQHFQQADAFHASERASLLQSAQPCFWGVGNLDVDEAALAEGWILVRSGIMRFQDGTEVVISAVPEDGNAILPSRSFREAWTDPHMPFTVFAGLPPLKPYGNVAGIPSCMRDGGRLIGCDADTLPEAPGRYLCPNSDDSIADRYALPLATESRRDMPVRTLYLYPRLFWENETTDRPDWLFLPLLRLTDEGSGPRPDPAYAPPSLYVEANPVLRGLARGLEARLAAAIRRLEPARRRGLDEPATSRQLLLVNAARTLSELRHALAWPGTAPHELFGLLRNGFAAAAACVRLAQPGLSAAGVRQMLYRYADDLGDPGRDDAYGYGLPVLTRYFHDRLCPGQRFRDMPASDIWSHEGLDYCIAAGLISGTSEVTVSPDMLATRAQIVQLLWAAAGSPKTTGTLPFTDVAPGAWYYDAVHWAYRTGLVSGTSPTTFTPDAAITRQDFTVILYAQAGRPAMIGTALAAFPDAGQVAGYAYAALIWAVEQGLIGGVGTPSGPQLAPRGYATRAQVAKILMGYYDK